MAFSVTFSQVYDHFLPLTKSNPLRFAFCFSYEDRMKCQYSEIFFSVFTFF